MSHFTEPAKKHLGQHFLHDRAIVEKIVLAVNPQPGDRLVEIGPGQGAITFPLLKPTLLLAVLLRGIDLMRIFDQIWILTQGGPGYATETVSLYIYRTAFRFFNFGYAAAMSFLGLLLTTLFARALIRAAKP